MNRSDYFQKQRDISRTAARAEAEAARRIRAVTRELVLPLVRQYAEQGTIVYPVEALAHEIDHIIREEGAKSVMAARKLQEDMEDWLGEKLGVKIKHRQNSETPKEARERRLNAAKRPVGSIIKTAGRGWGYGTSSQGLASYYRDPQTGKIVWTDLPLEYQFRKRADLSDQVWKAVEEQEQMVFDVIQGGRSLGRNVKDISKDLETFINYRDGGERVVGRWMGMFPNTEEGRREAWKREYLAAHGGFQPGSEAAKSLLRQPDAQAWVKGKMLETTKRGTPRLPDAVKQYAVRLGKAGLDYRAIRIARTEQTSMLADEQLAIAENSDICTGEMDFVMERGRDHWHCNCPHYAEQNPWKVDDPERPEIPVHENCMCEWRPRLKTDAEILAALREEMKEDLETIEGTEEQRELLEKYGGEEAKKATQGESLLSRFGERFDGYMRGLNERIGKTTWESLSGETKEEIIKGLSKYNSTANLSPEEFFESIDKIVQEGSIVTHQDVEKLMKNIEAFENDPRLKTLFETGTSQAQNDKRLRNMWEHICGREELDLDAYGADRSTLTVSEFNAKIGGVGNRPVYSEIIPKGVDVWHHGASRYGDLHMVLNNDLRLRTTFQSGEMTGSFTDKSISSFNNINLGEYSHHDEKNINNLINLFIRAEAPENAKGFSEAQTWGGIDLRRGDVVEVVVTKTANDKWLASSDSDKYKRLLNVFSTYNIPVRIVK